MGVKSTFFLISLIIALFAVVLNFTSVKDYVITFGKYAFFKYTLNDEPFSIIERRNAIRYTKEELSQYHGGEGSKGLYVSLFGRIFDVSEGRGHYGPGGGYEFFAAKDATRAFVTGEFNELGLIEDVTGLSTSQMLDLQNWLKFYQQKYPFVGILIGEFYDENGEPTKALLEAAQSLEVAHEDKEKQNEERRRFPNCNTQNDQSGRQVWCSLKSGGIERDWVGVPRRFFTKTGTRCACVRNTGPPTDDPGSTTEVGDLKYPGLQTYPGCADNAEICRIID